MNQNDPISKNHASGSGSAHLRYSMFGARGPLLNEHDGGSASAGSGTTTASTAASTTTETTAATPPPAANAPKTFTQEEVNRLVGSAREDGRRSVQQAAPAKPNGSASSSATSTVTTTVEAPKPTLESIAAQLEDERVRREFAEYAADYSVPRGLREDMFDLYRQQRPEDRAAWFRAKQERFGFKPQAAGNTATTATAATPTTNAANMATPGAAQTAAPQATTPPAVAPTAPAGAALPTVNGVIDLFSLSASQVHAMPLDQFRAQLDRLVEIGQQMQGAPQRPKVPSGK